MACWMTDPNSTLNLKCTMQLIKILYFLTIVSTQITIFSLFFFKIIFAEHTVMFCAVNLQTASAFQFLPKPLPFLFLPESEL